MCLLPTGQTNTWLDVKYWPSTANVGPSGLVPMRMEVEGCAHAHAQTSKTSNTSRLARFITCESILSRRLRHRTTAHIVPMGKSAAAGVSFSAAPRNLRQELATIFPAILVTYQSPPVRQRAHPLLLR